VKKKRCFTIVEVLMASSILLVVITAGISLLLLINTLLFDSQIESSNRTNLNDTIFYLTREIQSAEGVIISSNGKKMKIKQRGSEDYSLSYTITENYPVDYLAFKDKRLIDIDCDGSGFSFSSKGIVVTLQIVKNNIQLNQSPQEISFEVAPRSDSVVLEIYD
jgi:hypothetical protein